MDKSTEARCMMKETLTPGSWVEDDVEAPRTSVVKATVLYYDLVQLGRSGTMRWGVGARNFVRFCQGCVVFVLLCSP